MAWQTHPRQARAKFDSVFSVGESFTTPVEPLTAPPDRTLFQEIRAELGMMLQGLRDAIFGDRGH